ncbi:MAG: 16S rRNA (cytidine(1402)-2'-O)-methyltransferase, partial [Methylococcales bacterium]
AEVLGQVALVAAEDTRSTRHLLNHYGISAKLVSLHEHNEHRMRQSLIQELLAGNNVAVVSDAGTPLINDPGFELVEAALENGLCVVPIPGANAMIAALSVAGLATDRFGFYGFPPRSSAARKEWLCSLIEQSGTLVFYESCHRIKDFLIDCAEVFPAERKLVIARELTKIHESVIRTRIGAAISLLETDPYIGKGELVVLIEGARVKPKESALTAEHVRLIEILLEECSVMKTAELVVRITGLGRKLVYAAAIEIEKKRS